ncbi:MAG: hypothetical protein KDI55_18675 [Anaerolineae bacterium]|nr:hypothetical protein [Anaerolineae bacterium]
MGRRVVPAVPVDDQDSQEDTEELEVPEPFKSVRVLDPFLVSYDGTAYWPDSVVEVPVSLAEAWILNRWVVAN